MRNRRIRQVVWFTIVLVLVYTAFLVVTDARRNLETLRRFPWASLPLILAAVLANFTLRWVKWEFYARAAGIRTPLSGSFMVYFSGLSMAISPGRSGELIKPFMYKEYFGQKMRHTIPLVFCERVSDLLGMVTLTVATAGAFAAGVVAARSGAGGQPRDSTFGLSGGASVTLINVFLGLTVLTIATVVVTARSKGFVYGALRRLERISPRLAKLSHGLRRMYYKTHPLLTLRNLAIATALASVSWFFECVALWMVMQGVGATQVTLAQSAFLFCMATIFGGFLFFAPGGLGGFEGAMGVMLKLLGVAAAPAATGMALIRFCTLFFSVALGFVFISLTGLKYHKAMQWDEFENAD